MTYKTTIEVPVSREQDVVMCNGATERHTFELDSSDLPTEIYPTWSGPSAALELRVLPNYAIPYDSCDELAGCTSTKIKFDMGPGDHDEFVPFDKAE